MAIEFTIEDISSLDMLEDLIKITGPDDKQEKFVLYMASLEINKSPMGGIIRLEDSEGRGFEVGRVWMTVGSFPRPVVKLTTFNSSPQLIARFLSLCADQNAMWKEKMRIEREEYEASK